MAYTYYIKCLATNQHYYGVRFAKKCSPDDLWVTYFTSSKYVKELIKKYSKDGFLFEVRKVFSSSKKAREWEHRVLRRLNVVNRTDFLNKTDNISINSQGLRWWTDGVKNTKAVTSPGPEWRPGTNKLGIKRSKESIQKQMDTRFKKYGSYATNKDVQHSSETKEKISASKLGKKYGPQTIEHINKRKMIGAANPMFGKTHSIEAKSKISNANKKPKTDEHKLKISKSLINYHTGR